MYGGAAASVRLRWEPGDRELGTQVPARGVWVSRDGVCGLASVTGVWRCCCQHAVEMGVLSNAEAPAGDQPGSKRSRPQLTSQISHPNREALECFDSLNP